MEKKDGKEKVPDFTDLNNRLNSLEDVNLLIKLDIIHIQDNNSEVETRLSVLEEHLKLLEEMTLCATTGIKQKMDDTKTNGEISAKNINKIVDGDNINQSQQTDILNQLNELKKQICAVGNKKDKLRDKRIKDELIDFEKDRTELNKMAENTHTLNKQLKKQAEEFNELKKENKLKSEQIAYMQNKFDNLKTFVISNMKKIKANKPYNLISKTNKKDSVPEKEQTIDIEENKPVIDKQAQNGEVKKSVDESKEKEQTLDIEEKSVDEEETQKEQVQNSDDDKSADVTKKVDESEKEENKLFVDEKPKEENKFKTKQISFIKHEFEDLKTFIFKHTKKKKNAKPESCVLINESGIKKTDALKEKQSPIKKEIVALNVDADKGVSVRKERIIPEDKKSSVNVDAKINLPVGTDKIPIPIVVENKKDDSEKEKKITLNKKSVEIESKNSSSVASDKALNPPKNKTDKPQEIIEKIKIPDTKKISNIAHTPDADKKTDALNKKEQVQESMSKSIDIKKVDASKEKEQATIIKDSKPINIDEEKDPWEIEEEELEKDLLLNEKIEEENKNTESIKPIIEPLSSATQTPPQKKILPEKDAKEESTKKAPSTFSKFKEKAKQIMGANASV
ncbi:MAG: hypothetical protein KAQ92_04730, partial [Candidatus Aenigmarchaeota archaeon]|nr:hypothetical protein [Candidatus Aenigmarchaeota archaeon]